MATSAGGESGFVLPVGTVTLLLADIEGSTARWETRPAGMVEALARHDSLVSETVGRHGGVRPVEQGEGDSFVAAFSRPSDAVACALSLQRAFRRERWPEGADVRLRIALHTGEIQLRDEGNYVGQTINRCARLRNTAHGGQTVLSQATHELVVDRIPEDVSLRDLGFHRLGDLARSEHVYQLCHRDLDDAFPPLRSLDARPNNLPAQLTSFIGRETQIVAVQELLENARLVTLTGAAGCGKTRLALQVAAGLIDRYPDGVWFVELAPISDPILVRQQLATSLSLRQLPTQDIDLTELLARSIGSQSVLVILDNCEHVIAACAELADFLLRACPGLVVVATSREPFGLAGEVAWRIPSLDLPGDDEPSAIDSLTQYEAIELFIDRASRARPGFQVTNENAAAVAEICQQVDGIPLAIELAAARLRVLTAAQILDGLQDRFGLLTGGSRTLMPRQQTLLGSLDWSYELLSGSERALLRRLSVFAGGATLEAVERVCAFGDIESQQVLDLLSQVVDKSLVHMEEHEGSARYRLLESVRQYGRDKLAELGEEEEAQGRHCAYYVDLAEAAEPHLLGLEQEHWLQRLDVELGNLRAALRWSEARAADGIQLRLAGALLFFWTQMGRLSEGVQWLEKAFHTSDPAPTLARVKAHWALTEIVFSQGDIPTASQLAEAGLALARELGDPRWLARALTHVGWITSTMVDPSAVEVWEEAEALARQADDQWAQHEILGGHAIAHMWLGEPERARPLAEQLLALASRSGLQYHLHMALVVRAWAATYSGDPARARAAGEEVVARCREVGDPYWLALGSWQLGWALAYLGDYELARSYCEESLTITREQGIRVFGEAPALSVLSQIAGAEGNAPEARALAHEAVDICETHGPLPGLLSWHLLWLADAERLSGDVVAARKHAEAALEAAVGIGASWQRARAEYGLAMASRAESDLQRAEAHCHQALGIQRALPDKVGVTDTLELLAELASEHESFQEAARLLGAAESLRRMTGYVRFPSDRESHAAELALLEERLGDEDFTRAWSEGEAMSLDEAITYAQRGRGNRRRPSVGWASLTPTELDVARFVALGLSNPKIGERLFISRHTVESHLKHIFSKLGFASRTELAAEVTRRGL